MRSDPSGDLPSPSFTAFSSSTATAGSGKVLSRYRASVYSQGADDARALLAVGRPDPEEAAVGGVSALDVKCARAANRPRFNHAELRSTGQSIGPLTSSNFPHRDPRSADRGRPPIGCHARQSRGSPRRGSQHRRGDSLGRHWPAPRGYPRCAPDTDKSDRRGPAGSR